MFNDEKVMLAKDSLENSQHSLIPTPMITNYTAPVLIATHEKTKSKSKKEQRQVKVSQVELEDSRVTT